MLLLDCPENGKLAITFCHKPCSYGQNEKVQEQLQVPAVQQQLAAAGSAWFQKRIHSLQGACLPKTQPTVPSGQRAVKHQPCVSLDSWQRKHSGAHFQPLKPVPYRALKHSKGINNHRSEGSDFGSRSVEALSSP